MLRTRDDNILPAKKVELKAGIENSVPLYEGIAANKKFIVPTKSDAVPVDQFKSFNVYEDATNAENEKPADKIVQLATESSSVALAAAIRQIVFNFYSILFFSPKKN